MLAESFVVAGLGGLLGLGLAVAGMRAMGSLIPAAAMSGNGANLNGAVLLFALGATALSAITFGLAPAMQSLRAGVHSRLKRERQIQHRRNPSESLANHAGRRG